MAWLDRRAFLVRTGLGLAATMPDLSDWAAVRALFNLNPNVLHFGGLNLASHPTPLRDAIEAHRADR
jgi:hypothetical protein